MLNIRLMLTEWGHDVSDMTDAEIEAMLTEFQRKISTFGVVGQFEFRFLYGPLSFATGAGSVMGKEKIVTWRYTW